MLNKLAMILSEMGTPKLEATRVNLCALPMFEPYTVFKRLDQESIGYLTLDSICELLDDHQIIYTLQEVTLVYRFMDSDQDGVVSYQDFVRFCLPQVNIHLAQLTLLRESYFIQPKMLLPLEVEQQLLRLIMFFRYQTLGWRMNILAQLEELRADEQFSKLTIYRALKNSSTNKDIDKESLVNFMKSEDVPISEEEVRYIFACADQNRDGFIDYKELNKNLLFEDINIYGSPDTGKQIDNEEELPDLMYSETPVKRAQPKLNAFDLDQQSTVKKQNRANPTIANLIKEALNTIQQLKLLKEQLVSSGFQQSDLSKIFGSGKLDIKQMSKVLQGTAQNDSSIKGLKIFLQESEIELLITYYNPSKKFIDQAQLKQILCGEEVLSEKRKGPLSDLSRRILKKVLFAEVVARARMIRIKSELSVKDEEVNLGTVICSFSKVAILDLQCLLRELKDLMTEDEYQSSMTMILS